MKYAEKYCIEVTHQHGVRRFCCKSFEDAAIDDGWDFHIYRNMDDARAYWDDDEIPEELLTLLKEGKEAVEITYPDQDARYSDLADFDVEEKAFEYLSHDLNRLIVIESDEDADRYLKTYNGHEKYAVQSEIEAIKEKVDEQRKFLEPFKRK